MRILLALLLACIAFPAMAVGGIAPHCAPAAPPAMSGTQAHHGHHDAGHDMPAPASSARTHECIGCIPPGHGLARVADPQRFRLPAQRPLRAAAALAGAIRSPETPPPRTIA
ncbi:MAG: hypothetical protein DI547_01905 [Sphingobium sp.]|jgi:hypothetical protein|nr:MAG: hypothetical protein DI547_01905 [Sphingobium sp.]